MKSKLNAVKAFLVFAAVGGIPFITIASCDSYGASFFRDDDYGDYDDGYYYYDDYYYYDGYCDPFYCY